MRLRLRRERGRYWRIVAPKWQNDPLSGEGAARNGGRFNPKGTPALYLARDLMTAIAEYQQQLGVRPGTFFAFDIDVTRIADLSQPDLLRDVGLSFDELRAPWKQQAAEGRLRPKTWRVYHFLAELGCNGAIVPSVQFSAGLNLVLWRWNRGRGTRVKILDPKSERPT